MRFPRHRIQQSLPRPLRRPRPRGRQRQQRRVAAQLFQLQPASRARCQMRVYARAILSPQRIQRVQCEIVNVLFVLAHL
jgi:hypothetical protein